MDWADRLAGVSYPSYKATYTSTHSPTSVQHRFTLDHLPLPLPPPAPPLPLDSLRPQDLTKTQLGDVVEAASGIRLYDWQVECVQALLERKNVVCTMPCGGGKTVLGWAALVVLDWLAWEKEGRLSGWMVIGVAPRNGIEVQTARSARRSGLAAIAVNKDTVAAAKTEGRDLLREVCERRFRFVLVGPEFFAFPELDAAAEGSGFFDSILYLDLDECHTIWTEGESYRFAMRGVPEFPSRCHPRPPLLAKTATLSLGAEDFLTSSFHLTPTNTFRLHRSNDRPEVKWHFHYLSSTSRGASPFQQLDFILDNVYNYEEHCACVEDPEATPPPPPSPPPFSGTTFLFVETIKEVHEITVYLHSHLPDSLLSLVKPLHSLCPPEYRDQLRTHLEDGRVRVVVATRLAELGLDVRNVSLVVFWKVYGDTEYWVQGAGRLARQEGAEGTAVVMLPGFLAGAEAKKRLGLGPKKKKGEEETEKTGGGDEEGEPMGKGRIGDDVRAVLAGDGCPRVALAQIYDARHGDSSSAASKERCCHYHDAILLAANPSFQPQGVPQLSRFRPLPPPPPYLRTPSLCNLPAVPKNHPVPALSPPEQAHVFRSLDSFCHDFSILPPTDPPSTTVTLPLVLRERLVKRWHIITSLPILQKVLGGPVAWPFFPTHGHILLSLVTITNERLAKWRLSGQDALPSLPRLSTGTSLAQRVKARRVNGTRVSISSMGWAVEGEKEEELSAAGQGKGEGGKGEQVEGKGGEPLAKRRRVLADKTNRQCESI